jgi:SAM-dependent methyltransferase
MSASLPPDYFERVYREADDPWHFATSQYEAAKYAATLAALPRARYRNAFEIGCSIGVLTQRLAGRCQRLLAVDVAEAALALARARCAALPWVRLARMRVPDEVPAEAFDLILVSEVAYYWSLADLTRAEALIIEHLEPGGQLLLVHWTPFVDDYPLTGDAAHEAFARGAGDDLRCLLSRRAEHYRLDLYERHDGRPAAARA